MKRFAVAIAVLAWFGVTSAGAQVTSTTAKMVWTAPGDDSLAGRASQYDLRVSVAAITEANFLAATRIAGMAAPSASGAKDSVTVTGLAPSTAYFFAIKTADEVPNWSAISNLLALTTAALPDVIRPAPVLDLRVGP